MSKWRPEYQHSRDQAKVKVAQKRYALTDKCKSREKAWREANREHTREYNRLNRSKKNAARRANRAKDREYERQQRLMYPWKHQMKKARRRAAKYNATPWWLTAEDLHSIELWYRLAVSLGEQVDHIVPLKSPIVCGLHVPWNLRVIPAGENLSKGNREDPSWYD